MLEMTSFYERRVHLLQSVGKRHSLLQPERLFRSYHFASVLCWYFLQNRNTCATWSKQNIKTYLDHFIPVLFLSKTIINQGERILIYVFASTNWMSLLIINKRTPTDNYARNIFIHLHQIRKCKFELLANYTEKDKSHCRGLTMILWIKCIESRNYDCD